jgi:hypothetical protein
MHAHSPDESDVNKAWSLNDPSIRRLARSNADEGLKGEDSPDVLGHDQYVDPQQDREPVL